MQAYVALLRGINVGGRNKLPMKQLAALLEGLGLTHVRTYIQSGNVVFQSAGSEGLATEIGTAIEERFGFRPQVMILDEAALDGAISGNPFPEAEPEPSQLHLMFLEAPPERPDLEALDRLRGPRERFELAGRVLYLHAPDGIGRSKLAAGLERSLGVAGTARNWRTVTKLRQMIGEVSGRDH